MSTWGSRPVSERKVSGAMNSVADGVIATSTEAPSCTRRLATSAAL